MIHIPVLQKQVLEYLDPKANENFIDATFGNGGHTFTIFKENKPEGRILGIELDQELFKKAELQDRLILVQGNFKNLKEIVKNNNFDDVSGILIDLGFCSWHIEKANKGFTFQKDELLDMRFDFKSELTAREILNKWTEIEIQEILKEYGEERFAKRISRKICEKRKIKQIETTFQLNNIIKAATPIWYHHKKIHYATKTFQAIRIAVNDELNNLKNVLPQAIEILNPGGRLIVISFHSLEDRIVKNFFREEKKKKTVNVLTKKPITASQEEIKINSRSRSAKLRAIIKI